MTVHYILRLKFRVKILGFQGGQLHSSFVLEGLKSQFSAKSNKGIFSLHSNLASQP